MWGGGVVYGEGTWYVGKGRGVWGRGVVKGAVMYDGREGCAWAGAVCHEGARLNISSVNTHLSLHREYAK